MSQSNQGLRRIPTEEKKEIDRGLTTRIPGEISCDGNNGGQDEVKDIKIQCRNYGVRHSANLASSARTECAA
jgi:hypothetical protein